MRKIAPLIELLEDQLVLKGVMSRATCQSWLDRSDMKEETD